MSAFTTSAHDAGWCSPSSSALHIDDESCPAFSGHHHGALQSGPPPPPPHYDCRLQAEATMPSFPSHMPNGTFPSGQHGITISVAGNTVLPELHLPPLPPPPPPLPVNRTTPGNVRQRDSCNEGKVVELSGSWLDTLQYVFYRGYEQGPPNAEAASGAPARSPVALASDGTRNNRNPVFPSERRSSSSRASATRPSPAGGRGLSNNNTTSQLPNSSGTTRRYRDDYDMTELRKIQAEAMGDGIHDALAHQFALFAGGAAAARRQRSSTDEPAAAAAVLPVVSRELPGQAVRQNSPYQPQCSSYLALSQGGGGRSSDRILVISYHVTNPISLPPRDEPREGDPHLKLGGVLMDLGRVIIGSLIQFITAVAVQQVEMFLHNQGRCALYLNHPESEAPLLIELLNRRLWMGPHYALYATGPTATSTLTQYVQRVRDESGATCRHWPRHLVTVERWVPREEYNAAAAAAGGGLTPGVRQSVPECHAPH